MSVQESNTTGNAVKILGETMIPGASLLMDGKILSGGAHTIIGTWARLALGPLCHALVIANSYAKSTTGKGLLKQFSRSTEAAPAPKAEEPVAEEPKAEAKP